MSVKKQTGPSSLSQIDNKFDRSLIEPAAFQLMKRIAGFLTPQKIKAYVVGGYIRDTLLGRETADIDIAVKGDAVRLGKEIALALGGTFVLLDEVNCVTRIVLKDDDKTDIDLSSFSGDIENDMARRDFTIDAMALDLQQAASGKGTIQLLDPFHGREDLDFGIIRSVKAKSISDDPVRVLRAARLAVELGFTIERNTGEQIRKAIDLLSGVPGERVREELLRLFDVSRGGNFLFTLDELGILTALFPELTATKGVVQPVEHHWDVFTHSLMTVTALDFILHQGLWDYPDAQFILDAVPWSPAYANHFEKCVASGCTRRTLLKFAALFHDIAKPQTRGPDKKGRIRFLGHHLEGADVVKGVMERLRFSTRETKRVASVVQYHLRPTQLGEPPTGRAIYRYFRDAGDAGIDILYLSLADHLATRGPNLIPENWKRHADTIRYVLEEQSRKESLTPPVKLIDGNDLINLFGMKPGRELGRLLEAVREAQGAGELTSRQQALEYIHNALTGRGK